MIAFDKGLDGFFHSLIPAELRTTLNPHTAEYVRVRALTAMMLVTVFLPLAVTLILGGYHLFFNRVLLKYDAVSLAITVFFGLQAWFFYQFNHQWLSGFVFSNSFFLMVAVLLIISGGYASPMKAVLLTCPIISFLIGGRQEGLQNTIITVLFILALATLSSIQFVLPDLFREMDSRLVFVVNWVTTEFVIVVCIMVYETELQKRGERLQAIHDPTQAVTREFGKRVGSFFHRLIPERLRATLGVRSMAYTRVRNLAVMLVIATMASTLAAILLVGMHALFNRDQLHYDWVIVGIMLGFGLQTLLFYRSDNYVLSGVVLSYFYFLMALALVIANGGYDAPVMLLLLVCPIVFFMTGGIREGIQNALLVATVGASFGYFKYIGFEFHNVFHGVSEPVMFGIAWSAVAISIAACLAGYDTELEKPD
jgi:hypothetical protein